MPEKITCEYQNQPHCCSEEILLTEEDTERYLPREDQDNLIISRNCPIPALTSVIRYGPGYLVIKKGRKIRENFTRTLPDYKP
tara:strand:- start:252 stop:500 length:249 start_codon:yes stop_codon:yes gene_type:complete